MKAAASALVGLAGALALVLGTVGPAAAQLPTTLIVSLSDSADPAASGGQITYAVIVRNDGGVAAREVVVTIPLPPGTAFVRCSNTALTPCTLAGGTVTTALGKIRAWQEVRVSLTLTMPTVTSVSTVTVTADADSSTATDDRNSETTTVLPPGSFVTYLPSGRIGPIACGDTLTPESFGLDTIAMLSGSLGCTAGAWGLKITAPATTLDLNRFKIFWNAPVTTAAGTVGILVNAARVTIVGGSRGGQSGIEAFDWCVKDEGNAKKLRIDTLRCFRPRSAGFDIAAKKARILTSLVDRATIGTASNTALLPGGVGIHTRGDNVHIHDTIVRRSAAIGIWAEGADTNADGIVALIDGNTSTMRLEYSAGIGLLLDGGPHGVKDVWVQGDGLPGAGKDGVVVAATGVGNVVDGVVVKDHMGNGFVVEGTGTDIVRCNVEGVGLDGYVVTGPGSLLNGNGVQFANHGYVVTGLDTVLASNGAENLVGDGYIVNADNADASGNYAKANGGRAFVIGGNGSLYDTNTAESNAGDGFVVAGGGNALKGNRSKKSGGTGFSVAGTGNLFNSNLAELNTGDEWVIGPDNIDEGGNKASGSTFSFTSAGGTFN